MTGHGARWLRTDSRCDVTRHDVPGPITAHHDPTKIRPLDGARPGEPQRPVAEVGDLTSQAKPKSAILTGASSAGDAIRKFSGFRSLLARPHRAATIPPRGGRRTSHRYQRGACVRRLIHILDATCTMSITRYQELRNQAR